ncbi:hypothetical protein Pint_35380 [Pistacia integerrima]|uniref:Uncharacterized protein n=1 Tax=Pistacia integerrima TaxID=434235 RepID=A0ACC0Y5S9_9ROSI|nr:hypothetical protein Pint_35380 [Pistacia integerrima]
MEEEAQACGWRAFREKKKEESRAQNAQLHAAFLLKVWTGVHF